MADINDRLDRLHRREAFDQRVARPGAGTPAPEPAARRPPEHAHVAAAPPQAPPAQPPRAPAHPTPAPQLSRSGLPQRAPGQAAAAHRAAISAARSVPAPEPEPARAAAPVPARPAPRPAGVDDRLGEVLDAVAAVVRRHPGLSVMVAIADGRPGRPVIRVTEREGEVETGVVVGGASAPPATPPPTAADPIPLTRATGAERAAEVAAAGARPTAGPERPAGTGAGGESGPAPEGRRQGGRHAAPAADRADRADRAERAEWADGADWADWADRAEQAERAHRADPADPADRAGGDPGGDPGDDPTPGGHVPVRSSWHYSLWSADRSATTTATDGREEPADLRLVPDLGPEEPAEPRPPASTGTSQIVSRLAQLLREDPSLAAGWGREASDS